MPTLNYKHLRYFWMVAKTGSIARASEQLHLTPQSISGQLTEFESVLGIKLFRRAGRGLELTETGQHLLGYAEQIFALGDELLDATRGGGLAQSTPFRVGIADSVPKMVAYRLVKPALAPESGVRLICREGRLTALLAELAVHRIDMIIADRTIPDNLNVRGYDHFLGASGVTVFASSALLANVESDFPAMLDSAPFLMPGEDVALHSRLLRWFEAQHIRPRIVGEFDDSALLMAFGQAGAGFFVGPTAIESHVARQHGVTIVGRIDVVREQIYVITTERKLTNPVIAAICNVAQHDIFGGGVPKAVSGRARNRLKTAGQP